MEGIDAAVSDERDSQRWTILPRPSHCDQKGEL